MGLRNEVEQSLRQWDAYERGRKAPPVIDFDCYPSVDQVEPVHSRLEAFRQLDALCRRATDEGNPALVDRIGAHLAYLRALMGERAPLADYVRSTQGCLAAGWPDEYVTARGEIARGCLATLGIVWGPNTHADLNQSEGPLEADEAPEAIRQAAGDLEGLVRGATGTAAAYDLAITTTNVDAYWSYWLDGSGQRVRLRLNLRNAHFTKVRVRQFALHEVLGHGLQSASFAARCQKAEVPWVRLLSVHCQHQVLLEGLAQALPLLVTPGDQELAARTRLEHFLQLVRAELHLAINSGAPVADCAEHARRRVPFWTDEDISDTITDRGADPLLRSYLWSYPAGLDWFAALADADTQLIREVLRAAYRDPLTPADLTALWPAGPTIGGPGRAVRLRQPDVP